MKKILVLIPLLCIVGAIALHASAWAPRDLGTLNHKVVGHWSAKPDTKGPLTGAHLYFAPLDERGRGTFTRVMDDGLVVGTWSVVGADTERDTLRVMLDVPDLGGKRALVLSDDGKNLSFRNELLVVQMKLGEFQYVDATTSPEMWSAAEVASRATQIGWVF